MQAVILAGGLGTRLRPVTETIPKPMVPVAGKPFLEHQILSLREQGIDDILLLIGYLGEQIEEFFGDGSGHRVRITYSKEAAPLGTAGALRLAASKLQDTFLVLNGDTYLPMTYGGAIESFHRLKPEGLVVAYKKDGHGAKANLAISQDSRIIGADGARATHINAGAMVFDQRVLELIPAGKSYSLDLDVFPKLIERSSLRAYETPIRYFDMGTPEGLKRLEDFLSGTSIVETNVSRSSH
jgi:NDP-sugar pyrophosphorylase family protein